jgi:hypothetical protein
MIRRGGKRLRSFATTSFVHMTEVALQPFAHGDIGLRLQERNLHEHTSQQQTNRQADYEKSGFP